MNLKKSNFLHFHYGEVKNKTPKIQIKKTPVEEKDVAQYQMIDNKLIWKTQIQNVKTKLAREIFMSSKILYFLDEACHLKMYSSFV